jgi:amidohydrolase
VIGEGDLTATLCSEYDALPQIGHACGHNIIATAGVGAAIALAPVARAAGLRVKLLGTPAEEHGGGKVDMLRAGAWEDSTFSLMVHGAPTGDVPVERTVYTAVERFQVTFHGVASHAAGAPWLAVNASAAATLSLTAMALLRQHIPQSANINAYVSLGGEVTNIIPDRTVLQVEIRAVDLATHADVKKRVMNCFEGSAIATGCSWEQEKTENGYAPVDNDADLARFWDANLESAGRVLDAGAYGLGGGSTDMGNVTQVLPALHGSIAIDGCEAAPHQAAFAEAAATSAGDDAAIDGAAALAWTVLDVAYDPAVRADLLARQAARAAGATTIDSI